VVLVDSSVWIDFLNGRNAPHVRRLRAILGIDEVIVGDLMLCEVLQGLESEQAAREVEALLRRFEIVAMAGDAIAVAGARNFRFLCSTTTAIFIQWPAISDSGNSQVERGSFVARPHGSAAGLRHLIDFRRERGRRRSAATKAQKKSSTTTEELTAPVDRLLVEPSGIQAARGRISRAIAFPLSMRAFVRSCMACRFIQNSGLVP
jgi:hypothetical protein